MANHVIKRVVARPDAAVPFALGAPRLRANKRVQRFFKLRKNAPGFLGQTRTLSADKLTMTQVITWESEDAAKAFRQKHPRLMKAVMKIMGRYSTKRGHVSKARLVNPDGSTSEIVKMKKKKPAAGAA
jgi:hypothetical protein